VVDQGNNRIVKWTTNYSAGGVCIIGCTGTAGNALNQLNGPRDLKFDRDGNLYVLDQGNNRILKFPIETPITTVCPAAREYIELFDGKYTLIFYLSIRSELNKIKLLINSFPFL
jgi:DNA-binding beta-propeller fold protein YncE